MYIMLQAEGGEGSGKITGEEVKGEWCPY